MSRRRPGAARFCILGPLEAWAGERQLPLRGTKQRALLALLLLHANHVVSTDRLIEELWDVESHDAGRTALRVRIHELRKLLPDGVLETRTPGYVVNVDPDGLDLRTFERLLEDARGSLVAGAPGDASRSLDEALALWRGDPLADVSSERFALGAAVRLAELRLDALELRLAAQLELGHHAAVVAELEGLVAEYPLRESLCRLLMVALYRSGRQAEALDVYRHTRDVLSGELGLEPSASLRELERAILRQDPSLEPSSKRTGGRVDTATPRSVLVAGTDDSSLARLLVLAEPIASGGSHELILARLVARTSELGDATAALRRRREELEDRGSVARAAVFTSGRPGDDLARLSAEQDADLLLLALPDRAVETGGLDGDVAVVLQSAVCDVALLSGEAKEYRRPILVPFGGAEHDWAAVELGAWLAQAHGVELHLLGSDAVPQKEQRDSSRLLSHASLAVQRALGIHAEPILVTPGPDAILAASSEASVVVLGLSARWTSEGVGSARLNIVRNASAQVLLVRKGVRPGGLAPAAALTRFTWSVRA